jgi:hypothetical protein
MSTTIKQIERSALDAHRRGLRWSAWWPSVAADVEAAEPYNLERRRKLIRRLTSLVCCGDLDGQTPVVCTWGQPEPWELDDLAANIDCNTVAANG